MTAPHPTPTSLRFTEPSLGKARETLTRAADGLWRVQSPSGSIRGHLRAVGDPQGVRYRAERLHLPSGRFRVVGEFWRADDAVAALRYG